MTAAGSVYTLPGSPIRNFAEGLSWLWRLGPVLDEPDSSAVGLGWLEDAVELHALARAGRLAGAAVFATRPGPHDRPMPSLARFTGVASFGKAHRVTGQFHVLDSAGVEPAVRSSMGVHAIRDGNWMAFGGDPDASWGGLDGFWILPALAEFFIDVLERPLVMMPPVGWVRYDDLPGTAFAQILGGDKPDRSVQRRIAKVTKLFSEHGSRLNIAIAARALMDGEEVSIDEVWPAAVAEIGRGIEQGVIEPVCHGYLHLDTESWRAGEVSAREFLNVAQPEAERRLDAAMSWFRQTLGTSPATFVAPTWAYSPGLISALAVRCLPAWLPPVPGPLLRTANPRETLLSTMEGLYRFDYGPFAAMAGVGLPPSVVIHGALFDPRAFILRNPREAVTTARLIMRRDLFRFPWVPGVRWIGAGELLDRLQGHAHIEVRGSEILNPAGFEVVVRDKSGRRTLTGNPPPQAAAKRPAGILSSNQS